MVGVVTAVLAGSAAGLLAAAEAGHSAVAGFVTGAILVLAAMVVLMRFQNSAWRQIRQHPYFDCLAVGVPPADSEQHNHIAVTGGSYDQ
jgi:hypothetical protein